MKNSISTKPTKPNNIKSIFSTTEENDLIEWYKGRPKAIQDIAREVPF
jgi:hypothetical protein